MSSLTDQILTHQIYLERYARSISNEASVYLERLRDKLEIKILRLPDGIEASNQLNGISELAQKAARDIERIVMRETSELSVYESAFIIGLMSKFVTAELERQSVDLDLNSQLIDIGDKRGALTIKQIAQILGQWIKTQVTNSIRDDVLLNIPRDDVIKNVDNVIGGRLTSDLQIVTATSIAALSALVWQKALSRYPDIFTGWLLKATLDLKTTEQCILRNGKIIGYYDPLPPYHYNCRTKAEPYIDKKYRKGDLKTAFKDGETWLRSKSASEQDKILGVGRAEIFRGGMPLKEMVDPFGSPLTLQQLKILEGI